MWITKVSNYVCIFHIWCIKISGKGPGTPDTSLHDQKQDSALHKEFLEADCEIATLKKEKTNLRILGGRGQKGNVIIEKQNSIILFHSRLSLAVYRQNRTEYRSEENK